MKLAWFKKLENGTDCSLLLCERSNIGHEASDMAVQAINFIAAYDRCLEDRRIVGTTSKVLPLQAAMCGAFALEVGFKAVFVNKKLPIPRDQAGKKTHDLKTLFESLPAEDKRVFNGALDLPPEAFEQMLANISRLFERARYSYEANELRIDFKFLHTFILLIEPTLWKIAGIPAPARFAVPEDIKKNTHAHRVVAAMPTAKTPSDPAL